MELLKEFEEEKENNAADDLDDDDFYDSSNLFCEEVDEEEYDLCSGCYEKPIAHLVQTCGHMICATCVKNNKCQSCGCQVSKNESIDFDDFE